MDDVVAVEPSTRSARRASPLGRRAAAAVVYAVVAANAAVIVWLRVHGGNLQPTTVGEALTSLGRITGLLGAYLALLQVILLARLPALERAVGLDRLGVWHRWNGHACIDLVIAHVVLTVWGYALMDEISLGSEVSTMLGGGVYPGMITATIGTAMLLAVVATSVVVVRRRLSYEWWYAVHLLAYAGIALSWFHEIPTGNELVLDPKAADYWSGLYLATLAILVVFRIGVPVAQMLRHRLRVADVVAERPDVVSLHIVGRKLDRLRAEPGQFFLWRFLDRRRVWSAHPFSLSAAPDGRSLRITVKALGDHTAGLAGVRPGTRVLAEGPFGVFTESARRRREKVLLVGGGIGITPIRSLVERMRGDVVLVYRALTDDDLVLRPELDALAERNGVTIHYVVGNHTGEGRRLLSPEHLRELVPDAHGARRVPLRPARDGRRSLPPAARCGRPAPSHPPRALRLYVERRPRATSDHRRPRHRDPRPSRRERLGRSGGPEGDHGKDEGEGRHSDQVVHRHARHGGPLGNVQVTVVVKKTITTNLTTKKKTVKRRITSVDVPVYPDHTDRSVFINERALPTLVAETIQKQSTAIDMVSGATDTSEGYVQSLQAAILAARAW